MKELRNYLLIDDDSTSNLIGEFVIKSSHPGAKITSFLDAEVALNYIREEYSNHEKASETLLFLDLNMPKMTGWEFLEFFEQLQEKVQDCFRIHILTSSIEDFSEEKKKFPFVRSFISKPLKKDKLQRILSEELQQKNV